MAEEKAAPPTPVTPAADTSAQVTQGKASDTKTVETVGQVAKTAAPSSNPLMDMLPMLIGMMIIFYLLMIRPENKRRKQQQDMLGGLKKNDKVVLAGSGFFGIVKDIDGEEITVLIDAKKDVSVKVRKEFIGSVVSAEEKKA